MNELTPIPNFPGYLLTTGRRVWSEKSKQWLKTYIDNSLGRMVVSLRRDGRSWIKSMHRLMLETFVGPCPEGMEARHLDGNRLNDDLGNLTWGTHGENMRDAALHGILGSGKGSKKLTDQQVIEIRYRIANNVSCKDLARQFRVSSTTIHNVRNRKHYPEVR